MTERTADVPQPRPARDSISEIAGLALVAVLLVAFAVELPTSSEWGPNLWDWSGRAGLVVLEHIGWGFGVYIPTLLGFYAIVIGGQLVAPEMTAGRARRVLGFVAEITTAAFTPAVVLVVIACVQSPNRIGAILVVGPVAGIMLFLTVQLGGFLVFESQVRLANAQRTRVWAQQRLRSLQVQSRKPGLLVVLLSLVCAPFVGALVFLVLTGGEGFGAVLLAYTILGTAPALAGLHALVIYRSTRDRLTRVLIWVFPALLYLGVGVVAAAYFTAEPARSAISIGLVTTVGIFAASTFLPRSLATNFLLDWSLQGVGVAHAARSVERIHQGALHEIQELAPISETPTAISLVERLRMAAAAMAGKSVPRGK